MPRVYPRCCNPRTATGRVKPRPHDTRSKVHPCVSSYPLLFLVVGLAVGGYWFLGTSDTLNSQASGAVSAAPDAREAASSGSGSAVDLAAVEGAASGADALRRTATEASPERALSPTASAAPAADNGTVVGRVLDAQGRPIEGAEVRVARHSGRFGFPGAMRSSGAKATTTTADHQGRFELAAPQEGPLELSVGADGFEWLKRDLVAVSGVEDSLGDLELALGITISGKVVDAQGAPIAGAKVAKRAVHNSGMLILGGDGDANLVRLTETATDGTFEVPRHGAGDWSLVVQHERHPRVTHEGDHVRAGERRDGVVIVLPDGVALSGLVTDVPEDAGELVVRVRRVGQGSSGFSFGEFDTLRLARAHDVAADGTFTVQGLVADVPYEIAAYARQEQGFGRGARRSPKRRVTADTLGLRLAHGVGAQVSLQIVDGTTRAPIENLDVSAGFDFPVPIGQGPRGEGDVYPNGQVTVDDLWPSSGGRDLSLRIEAPGYGTWTRDDLRVAAGDAIDLGIIELHPRPEIVVVVTDSSGAPVAGARVELSEAERPQPVDAGSQTSVRSISMSFSSSEEIEDDGNGEIETTLGLHRGESETTDGDGVARLGSLPGKTARVTVAADGFARWRSPIVDLPSNGGRDFEARLERGGEVLVTVLDRSGVPVAGGHGGEPLREGRRLEFIRKPVRRSADAQNRFPRTDHLRAPFGHRAELSHRA